MNDLISIDRKFIKRVFDKPKIIGVIADVNQGKSMLLYNLLEGLKDFSSHVVTFGLRADIPYDRIYSIEELENVTDSIIIVDEFFTLFDLNDRKKARLIEQTLRLINHNNNILILAGVGENFKKFISNKLSCIFFKSVTLGDFTNGSRVKNVCMNYKGYELGTTLLKLPIDKALFFDGSYIKLNVNYIKKYDTKLKNKKIVDTKKCSEKCGEECGGKCAEKKGKKLCSKKCAENVEENVESEVKNADI